MTQNHVLRHLLVDFMCKARLLEAPRQLDDLVDLTVKKLHQAVLVQDALLNEFEVCDRWKFLTPAKLRNMRPRRQGPLYLKFGAAKTSRVYYRVGDVEKWIVKHYQLEPFLAPPPHVKRRAL